ncbi:DUF1264 domain-containing protein [Pseudomonas sp. HY13-MNA-CIBAN-0226]|uniref:DUF1264 domain-containing protein n=1 Tax=Pseudomonas sp. HY13-MNA-CIBAN-0226 TaxID=3140473 RepID=UPI003316BF3E
MRSWRASPYLWKDTVKWDTDLDKILPLGTRRPMMSFTVAGEVNRGMIKDRVTRFEIESSEKIEEQAYISTS